MSQNDEVTGEHLEGLRVWAVYDITALSWWVQQREGPEVSLDNQVLNLN